MFPIHFKILILLVLLSFCFTACSPTDQPVVRLLVSGNTNGLFLPCDCEVGPMGGLAKRQTLFRRLSGHGIEVLRFDTGGFVGDFTVPAEIPAVTQALTALQYNTILLGPSDTDIAVQTDGSYPVEFAFHPVVKEETINGLKVSWLAATTAGLISDLADPVFQENAFALAGNADIWFWLVYMEDDEVIYWLQYLTPPDFIIQGPCDYAKPAPDTLVGIPVYRAGVDGIDILVLDFMKSVDGTVQLIPSWSEVTGDLPEDRHIKRLLAE